MSSAEDSSFTFAQFAPAEADFARAGIIDGNAKGIQPFLTAASEAKMIALLLTPPILAQAAPADPAVELCKPVLARKAGGEIATIDVDSNKVSGGTRTIGGRLTAFSRMGPAPAGTARTHHVIRFDFIYRCQVRAGRIRHASVKPFRL